MIHFYKKLLRPQDDQGFNNQRYAKAFVNQLTPAEREDSIARYLSLSQFFAQNKRFLIDLIATQANIEAGIERKIVLLKDWFELNLKDIKFLNLLISRKKNFYLVDIFKYVAFFASKLNLEKFFLITTSRSLDSVEKDLVGQFLIKKIEFKPRITFVVDTTLISGLRIESDCFLYEKSIKSRLRKVFITLRSITK